MRMAFKLSGIFLKPLDFDYGVMDWPKGCKDVLSTRFAEFLHLKARSAIHKD